MIVSCWTNLEKIPLLLAASLLKMKLFNPKLNAPVSKLISPFFPDNLVIVLIVHPERVQLLIELLAIVPETDPLNDPLISAFLAVNFPLLSTLIPVPVSLIVP